MECQICRKTITRNQPILAYCKPCWNSIRGKVSRVENGWWK